MCCRNRIPHLCHSARSIGPVHQQSDWTPEISSPGWARLCSWCIYFCHLLHTTHNSHQILKTQQRGHDVPIWNHQSNWPVERHLPAWRSSTHRCATLHFWIRVCVNFCAGMDSKAVIQRADVRQCFSVGVVSGSWVPVSDILRSTLTIHTSACTSHFSHWSIWLTASTKSPLTFYVLFVEKFSLQR